MGLLRAALPRGRPGARPPARDRDPGRAGAEGGARRPPRPRRRAPAAESSRSRTCSRRPEARAVGLDISVDALALARENARAMACSSRLSLVASDWLSALGPRASTSSCRTLPTSRSASRRTCRRPSATTIRGARSSRERTAWPRSGSFWRPLPPYLAPGGLLVFEIGFGQSEAVRSEILDPTGLALPRDRAGPRGHPPHLPRAARIRGGEGPENPQAVDKFVIEGPSGSGRGHRSRARRTPPSPASPRRC